jgi:predicted GNAT family acetyltransferase
MHVCRHPDVASFSNRARVWLMRAEVENNLILGLCNQILALHVPVPEAYFASVEDADHIMACALRTPPFKAVITRGNEDALQCLVEDLSARYGTLPAVLGPEPEVRRFAAMWSKRVGTAARLGMQQRVFEARAVRALTWQVPGTMRLANEGDLPTLVPWLAAFHSEVQVTETADPNAMALERIAQKRLYVWEDGKLVSMAAQASQTPTGAGINLVYTPPAFRQRGYASACVATLTSHLLATGHAYCCLFTDLANQTSNSIYQRIGYQPVCDMSDFVLENV